MPLQLHGYDVKESIPSRQSSQGQVFFRTASTISSIPQVDQFFHESSQNFVLTAGASFNCFGAWLPNAFEAKTFPIRTP